MEVAFKIYFFKMWALNGHESEPFCRAMWKSLLKSCNAPYFKFSVISEQEKSDWSMSLVHRPVCEVMLTMPKFNIKQFRINPILSHLTIVAVDYITVTPHLFSPSMHQLFFSISLQSGFTWNTQELQVTHLCLANPSY